MYKKKLEEMILKDDFLFGAVMSQEDLCREFLELVLGFPVERVEVDRGKSLVYNPHFHGIRLDVIARDAAHTHYDVEMQAVRKKALGKRARYYQGQMTVGLLEAGEDYDHLPDTYVIFICDFDPFGGGRYRYEFAQCCLEYPNLRLQDGARTIFLSTQGGNAEDMPKSLVKFLQYVRASLEESTKDFQDEFVRRIQKEVRKVKSDQEIRSSFMTLEELLREEREEGRTEGMAKSIMVFLTPLGAVPRRIQESLYEEKNPEVLEKWLRAAGRADSIEAFIKSM